MNIAVHAIQTNTMINCANSHQLKRHPPVAPRTYFSQHLEVQSLYEQNKMHLLVRSTKSQTHFLKLKNYEFWQNRFLMIFCIIFKHRVYRASNIGLQTFTKNPAEEKTEGFRLKSEPKLISSCGWLSHGGFCDMCSQGLPFVFTPKNRCF